MNRASQPPFTFFYENSWANCRSMLMTRLVYRRPELSIGHIIVRSSPYGMMNK